MKYKQQEVGFIICLSVLSGVFIFGCGGVEIESVYRENEIIIDGNYTDWQGLLYRVEEKEISMGFQHDDNFLYGCILSNNLSINRQIMGRGLILKLKAKDSDAGAIIIKYPLGLMGSGFSSRQMKESPFHENLDTEQLNVMKEENMNALQVQWPKEKEFQHLFVTELHNLGWEIKLGHNNGVFVYEFGIPLQTTDSICYALASDDIRSVQMDLKVPEIDRDGMRDQMHGMGGPGDGGMGGGMSGGGRRGGGMKGGGPGMHGGGMKDRMGDREALHFSVYVKLNSRGIQ